MAGPTEVPDPEDVVLALRTAELAADEQPLEFDLLHFGAMERGLKDARGAWQDDTLAPTHAQVDQLEDRGLVRVTAVDGKRRTFYLTDEGRQHARLLANREQASEPGSVDLRWDVARPLLETIVAEYEARGAPELGIAVSAVAGDQVVETKRPALLRQLRLHDLVETNGDTDQNEPQWVAPTARAMQLLRRWPSSSGEAIVEELVAALTARIEQADDGEERTALIRVRDGLAGAARDITVGVLTGLARESL